MAAAVVVDGSLGEGGGQILRTSLSLAAILGMPVRVHSIRAGRPKPGLQRQHLVAAQAAAACCGGTLHGATLGSSELTLQPGAGAPAGARFTFDIGSAGSTTLVLQTVLPILMCAGGGAESREVVITGGTHNPLAPSFDFLASSLLPVLVACGFDGVALTLERAGFFPAGGGRLLAHITPLPAAPAQQLRRLSLLERGAAASCSAVALLAGALPARIGESECAAVRRELGWADARVERASAAAAVGAGNVLTLRAAFAHVTETVTSVGERGVSAEEVARRAVVSMRAYLLASSAPVGEHLADQLLLPLALMAGGEFRATAASQHLETNALVINRLAGGAPVVTIAPAGAAPGDGVLVTVRAIAWRRAEAVVAAETAATAAAPQPAAAAVVAAAPAAAPSFAGHVGGSTAAASAAAEAAATGAADYSKAHPGDATT